MKGKKRLLGPPPSFFTEEEDEIKDHGMDEGSQRSSLMIPQTISNYKNDGLSLVDHDPVVSSRL
jgi:hypothetical protein